MSFKPLQPRNLGFFTDIPMKNSESVALDAIQNYIDSLKRNITMLEGLRDSMALLILELISQVRARETEDFLLLGKLDDIESKVKAM